MEGAEGKRVVMILTVDFHAEEDTLLVYSAKPVLDLHGSLRSGRILIASLGRT